MKILTHKELESKDALLPLMDIAFGWPYNPRRFGRFASIDPRLKNGSVGFAAVENDSVVGFVGVMDMATRTADGNIEYVGGVYGVATLPSHVRRGISMALMNEAHRYFREKGYRFSFLCTSHTIVAHTMYVKLGYTDLLERPSAYKVLKEKRSKSAVKAKTQEFDSDRLLQIYNKYVRDKTGFVVRDEAYLRMLKRAEGFSGKECIIGPEGYVLFKSNVGGAWSRATWIRELVALNTRKMKKLLDFVESRAKDLIIDRAVLDERLLEAYRSHGYMIQRRSHGVVMVKPLTADASFKQTYGDRFYLTGLDFF